MSIYRNTRNVLPRVYAGILSLNLIPFNKQTSNKPHAILFLNVFITLNRRLLLRGVGGRGEVIGGTTPPLSHGRLNFH